MKKVVGWLITLLIHLLFRLRKTLLERGWIDVRTPQDLYVHLQADNVRRSKSKARADVQRLILKAHEADQRAVLIPYADMDETLAQEFLNACFTVVEEEESGNHTIMW